MKPSTGDIGSSHNLFFLSGKTVRLQNTSKFTQHHLYRISNKCRESKAVSSFDVVKSTIRSTRPRATETMIQADEYKKFVLKILHFSSRYNSVIFPRIVTTLMNSISRYMLMGTDAQEGGRGEKAHSCGTADGLRDGAREWVISKELVSTVIPRYRR